MMPMTDNVTSIFVYHAAQRDKISKDIETLIKCEEILDPRTIESKTSSWHETIGLGREVKNKEETKV